MNKKLILEWLDKNLLLVLSGFLLAFIPLYPKIPLYSPIEQYIVRVRLEDFFVLLTAVIWLVQVARRKIRVISPLVWFIGSYVVVGLLSVLSAVFLIKTVPLQPIHLAKTLLHYFRYMEYFSLLFIIYSAVQNMVQVKKMLVVSVLTLIGVTIYGYGQKFYYWPVYSTMNREFSKGVRLYLTEHARVQSTFAGHYDLGGYLVIILPIILALALTTKSKVLKIVLHVTHWLGLWLLVVSAARSSFVAYLVGASLIVLLLGLKQLLWKKKISWILSRQIGLVAMVTITMFYFGDDMYERFLQILNAYPEIAKEYHLLNDKRKTLFQGDFEKLIWGDAGMPKFKILPEPEKPANAISTDEAAVLVSSDERPVPYRPSDVYEDIPDLVPVASVSASGSATIVMIEIPRTFSDNALKHGLSLAIRLDTLWPQAIKGFWRNPFVGSGYATLNKEGAFQFTEADSTDNNFLRTLGETGALGFVTFYGTIIAAVWLAFRGYRQQDELIVAFSVGFIGASVGLLLNATYIDVFAASKDAFTYWGITGLYVAALASYNKDLVTFKWLKPLNDKIAFLQPTEKATAAAVPVKTTKKQKKKRAR